MEKIKVPAAPMALPEYKIPENYTTDDLRCLCVKAMRDILSISWTADKVYEYRNKWDLPKKLFSFGPGKQYAGLPYANAHTGIFQWFYHYDPETGVMSFDGDGQEWGETLGTVCANCILWAWSIVANSMAGKFHSFTMSPMNHFVYPGDIDVPGDIEDFRNHSTELICKANGDEKILGSYAAMLPADGLISTPQVHAVMVVEKPGVVYNADGTIDAENSTVMIQDQRGGQGEGFYERECEGTTLHFSGRIDHVYSFKQLLDWCYIPVTCLELQGKRPVEQAWLTFEGDTSTPQTMLEGTIRTNYLLCTVEALLVKPDGTRKRAAIRHYTKADTGLARICDGVEYTLELPEPLKEARAGDKLRIEARIANGQLFVLGEVPVQ